MERYYVSLTPDSGGYYSVIDRTRKNEFGERYALACYLSKQEAFDFLADIRNCEDVVYAADHLGYYDQSDANEDAEYGAEYALYGEAETRYFVGKAAEIFIGKFLSAADWKDRGVVVNFDDSDADYTFGWSRRYPLLDAARIEAE
jgi:hypothetical protein